MIKTKKNINMRIDSALIDRVRNIIYWTPDYTFNKFCEEAILEEVEVWESKQDFKEREGNIKIGRRAKIQE